MIEAAAAALTMTAATTHPPSLKNMTKRSSDECRTNLIGPRDKGKQTLLLHLG
jgi:energy-coupling factor transporter ATP-binding protein EcfA2